MTDNIEHLILEQFGYFETKLKGCRQKCGTTLVMLSTELIGLNRLLLAFGAMKREQPKISPDNSHLIDRLKERIDRIEHRLELT